MNLKNRIQKLEEKFVTDRDELFVLSMIGWDDEVWANWLMRKREGKKDEFVKNLPVDINIKNKNLVELART